MVTDADAEMALPAAVAPGLDLSEALAFAAKRRTAAMVVLCRGEIVAEHYLMGWDAHVPAPLTSVSKSIVAMLVGVLLKQGLLADCGLPVTTWLPEWRDDPRGAITLRMLLNMTSGLRNPPLWRLALKGNRGLGLDLGLAHAPGSHWEYNTAAYRLLFTICERVTGQGMRELCQRELFDPLGMQRTRWLLRRSDGTDGDGADSEEVVNIAASALDLGCFGQFVLQRGVWQGRELVAPAYFDEALHATQPHNPTYGYLFWLNRGEKRLFPDAPEDTVAAMGARYCRLFVIPSLELVVVRTGERAALAGEAIGKRSGNQQTFDNQLLRLIAQAVEPAAGDVDDALTGM